MMAIRFFPRLYRETGTDSAERWVPGIPHHWTKVQWMQSSLRHTPMRYMRQVARMVPGLWIETGRGWTFDDSSLAEPVPSSWLRCSLLHRRWHRVVMRRMGKSGFSRFVDRRCLDCQRTWTSWEIIKRDSCTLVGDRDETGGQIDEH